MTKRKGYSGDFEAQVALAAIREDLTTAELAKQYGVHPTMIGNWKKQAVANMASVFGGAAEKEPPISPKDVEKLHAKIGQLAVERDFLSEASSLILGAGGKRR